MKHVGFLLEKGEKTEERWEMSVIETKCLNQNENTQTERLAL